MTLSIVPVDQAGIDNIADGLSGFTDESSELQQSMMTTLFIAGASDASKGRCAYLLLEDGSRMWVPNSLRCWIVDLQIKTQQYESYDPVEKLLILVTAVDGTTYVYRCGFDSWTATSFLTQFKHMSRQQLADQVTITLRSKGRATFVDLSYCENGQFHRVQLPESAFTGEKLGYDERLNIISYVNGTSQDNEDSPFVEAQVQVEEESFEVPAEEIEELLDEIRKPKRSRRKASATKEQAIA
ncbi:hypothetical protein [Synechococcus sp. CC9605]|uniref:hypothetical protein n=1 Tax=Synechococcus sp. (strain CC9605) TaxID=110662 RepID=UPI00005D5AB6|nr:hypothetical protein [Synechococcus sp. CC9605]ABB35166.1 conserved hypothetical protein [Synechococcus sp. CC9605]